MLLRTINAGFSLVSSGLVLTHAISLSFWMLSRGSVPKPGIYVPWILTALVAVHALLSIGIMISSHKGTKKTQGQNVW